VIHNLGQEVAMEGFIHRENIALLKKRLAECQDEAQRRVIPKLLEDEESKDALQPKQVK
jgi:hypothetical protein